MSFNIAYPSDRLKPYIKKYWSFENVLEKGRQHIQRIIPNGLPELIFYLEQTPDVVSSQRTLEDKFLLNGQHNDYYDLRIAGDLSVFSVMFQPQGVSQFFNIPLNELTNQSVPLRYIDKRLSGELQSRLLDSNSFQERIDAVEFHFLNLLAGSRNNFEFQRISHTIELIEKTKGSIDIDTLARNACLGRKQFERKFLALIGISPKQYLKTIRLQSAIFVKTRNSRINMTELAYESNYFDQSHFINDFKMLTGLTPRQYFSEYVDSVSDFFE